MGLISYLLLGLIAGAIAKVIMPGKQGGGWISTMFLGVVGAIIGGFIGSKIFNLDVMNHFFSLKSWIFAILGSLILLVIQGFFVKSDD